MRLPYLLPELVVALLIFAVAATAQPAGAGPGGGAVLRVAAGTGLAERAEPEGFTVDGVQYGIASKYVRDKGLADDPDVILFEDFEVDELADLEKRRWVPRNGSGRYDTGTGEKQGWKYYSIASEPGVAFAGTRCMKKSIPTVAAPAGKKPRGAKATWDLPEAREVVFLRTYLKLSAELPGSDPLFRILGVTGVADGQATYQTFGAKTPSSDGTGPFWIDLLMLNNTRRKTRELRVESKQTSIQYQLFGTNGKLPANRWLCLEIEVKLNTPGKRDGELRVWLDGKEVLRHPRMWYRSTDKVKIRSVCDQFYADHRRFNKGGHFWVDDIVVARKYIGPAVDKPLPQRPAVLFPLPQKETKRPQPKGSLAEKYPGDAGIRSDPDVIFVEDFEHPDWDKGWQERSKGHRRHGSLEADPKIVHSGKNSLKLTFVPEARKDGAGWMHHWYEGSDLAYLRYYYRLSVGGNWSNQKLMQLHGHKRGVRFGRGAGSRGIDWLSAGTGVGGQNGPPWKKTTLYNYHPHQKGNFGDVVGPTEKNPPPSNEDEWICKEFMVKLNDIGKINGEMRMWVNGKLVLEKTDMEWRRYRDVVINDLMQPTYTHSPPKVGKKRIVWLDSIVLAKRYIGPMRPAREGSRKGAMAQDATATPGAKKPPQTSRNGRIRLRPLLKTGGGTGELCAYSLRVESPWEGGGYFTVNYPEHLEFGPVGYTITRYSDPRTSAWTLEGDGKLARYDVPSTPKRGVLGVRVASRVEVVGPEKLKFSLKITNGSERTLKDIKPLLCFQYKHLKGFSGYLGKNFKYTHVVMGGKITALAGNANEKADAQVKEEFVKGVKPYRYNFAKKNGGYIDKSLDLGLSVITSQDGSRAIIIYTPVGRSMLSNRWIPCLHADPWFGHIKPGQSVQRTQYVVFAREDWRDEVRKIVAAHKQRSSK